MAAHKVASSTNNEIAYHILNQYPVSLSCFERKAQSFANSLSKLHFARLYFAQAERGKFTPIICGRSLLLKIHPNSMKQQNNKRKTLRELSNWAKPQVRAPN